MKLLKTAALTVAVSMIGLSATGDIAAAPYRGYIYFYYAEPGQFTEVGQKWLMCDGGHGSYGVVTPYVEKTIIDCNVGNPPGHPE